MNINPSGAAVILGLITFFAHALPALFYVYLLPKKENHFLSKEDNFLIYSPELKCTFNT